MLINIQFGSRRRILGPPVRKMVLHLPWGAEHKSFVDSAIDRCAHMHKLRTEIIQKRKKVEQMTRIRRKSAIVHYRQG